ncbi:hypothetical protein NPIL_172241 [Nephila pilipes]|uniref:Uncharacterized protein n=1 Tax=Nephila pilipes TaxID=299642 RepID=A0A8X6MSV5_NEPPI|nr:hypothetical protein NPIL_172241 [Nephila pilipes]
MFLDQDPGLKVVAGLLRRNRGWIIGRIPLVPAGLLSTVLKSASGSDLGLIRSMLISLGNRLRWDQFTPGFAFRGPRDARSGKTSGIRYRSVLFCGRSYGLWTLKRMFFHGSPGFWCHT